MDAETGGFTYKVMFLKLLEHRLSAKNKEDRGGSGSNPIKRKLFLPKTERSMPNAQRSITNESDEHC
ncbi:MAG: hypothetical protein FD123_2016 [Bacteroidetes bacterium]|nr:MAG: hypothetical protein FD123_2016 [Bacteroidota bacterium]